MILILAQHDNKKLHPATLSAITAAKQLGEITVLVAGFQCETVAQQAASVEHVSQVICVDDAVCEVPLPETYAQILTDVLSEHKFTHVIAPATTFGKNILPRFAAQNNLTQISDVIAIIDKQTYKRPIYAGNAIATVKNLDPVQVISIRPTAFERAKLTEKQAPIVTRKINIINKLTKFISVEQHNVDKPQLDQAEIIISGGRGLKDAAGFARLANIAAKMGAAFGASRAAVDAGLAPNDCQVGQTGKIVAPNIYFAVGISGAIQHIAGMKDSKIIIAINKDPEAPIFQVADYGIVADVDTVLPEWEAWLDK